MISAQPQLNQAIEKIRRPSESNLPECLNRFSSFQIRCGIVMISSGVDAFLAYYYRDHIMDLERNPVCLTLMAIEPDYLSVFIVAKFITTITVVAIICYVRRVNDQMGRLVATALASFQMGLLAYQISI